jgi:O-methyltransferase
LTSESDRDGAASAYLDLLKRAVHGYLQLGGQTEPGAYYVDDMPRYADAERRVPPDCRPHTVLHRAQLDLLELLARDVEARGVPGDFLEAGTWRGERSSSCSASSASWG